MIAEPHAEQPKWNHSLFPPDIFPVANDRPSTRTLNLREKLAYAQEKFVAQFNQAVKEVVATERKNNAYQPWRTIDPDSVEAALTERIIAHVFNALKNPPPGQEVVVAFRLMPGFSEEVKRFIEATDPKDEDPPEQT